MRSLPEAASNEEFFAGPEKSDVALEVEILEANILYAHVFTYCQPELVSGFGSFIWRNIAATEVHAVCLLLQIPQDQWPDILENVMFIGGEVASYLNAKGSR